MTDIPVPGSVYRQKRSGQTHRIVTVGHLEDDPNTTGLTIAYSSPNGVDAGQNP